jgi:glycolate oxidase iron-sulfur subunit
VASGASFASLAPLEPLMDKCVHCGFCLSTCPSYVLLGSEMASPRGRIYLMRGGLERRVDMSAAVVEHFDTCLGCMACETACPSGVRYAPLIEETRAAIEHHHRRPLAERLFRRLLFAVLPYPARLRMMAPALTIAGLLRQWSGMMRLLPARLRMLLAVAPSPAASRPLPERTAAVGETRARVGLVTGCVQQVFFGGVNEATARVLAAEGCEVVAPRAQGCCGALALHAGRNDDARGFARALIAAFEPAGVETVVVNAAGCGSAMKSYGELLQDDPAWAERARAFARGVRDVTEALDALEPRAARHPLPLKVAYHDACHLAHAQGVRREPRRVLERIPGVTIVPVADADLCCGSAGIFNLVQPDMAAQLGGRKAAALAATGADVIVTSNPGCMLQISASGRTAGHTMPIRHIVELIDASIRGERGL